MLKDLIISFQSYYQAHRFIRHHKLWKWIIIPGILYMVLFAVGLWFFITSSSEAIAYISGLLGIPRWLERMQSGWLNFFVIFDALILRLLLLLFYFSLFKYLFLVIGSPVFVYLSEKTEAIIEGTDYRFNPGTVWKDMRRSIWQATRNMLWQTLYTFTLIILSFVPVAGWITPLIAFLVECYYYGFSALDHSCARHKLSMSRSQEYVGERRGLAIGNGIVFYAMHLVLLVGWVIAPAYALVAATLSLYPVKRQTV